MFRIHGIGINGKSAVEVDFHGAADKLRLCFFTLYYKHSRKHDGESTHKLDHR